SRCGRSRGRGGCARSSSPDLPGRRRAGPELLEQETIAHGVHGLPEAVMAEGGELAASRELLQGFLLPHGIIASDEVDDRLREHEEAAVDEALACRQLLACSG